MKKILFLIIPIVVFGFFFFQDAQAATEILRPIGPGSLNQVSNQSPSSGSHWDKVDEASADDDATYVYTPLTGAPQTDLYSFSDHTGSGIINSVTVYMRIRSGYGNGATANVAIRTNGANYYGVIQGGDTWTSHSTIFTENPANSYDWTWADIDALEAGFKLNGVSYLDDNGDPVQDFALATQVYVVVDYNPNPLPGITTLRPNAPGDITQLRGIVPVYVQVPSQLNWTSVNDIISDGWNSYVYSIGAWRYDLYNLPNRYSLGTINNVTVYARVIALTPLSSVPARTYIKTNGQTYSAEYWVEIGAGWQIISTPYANNPQTSNPWTWAEINALQAGAGVVVGPTEPGGDDEASYATQVYVEVNYTPSIPVVTTQSATNITLNSATGNGNITSTGGENAFVRGFKYGLTQTDTWSVSDSGYFGTGAFAKAITGLSPDTTYWYRAFAVNSAGTGYGSYVSFTTVAIPCQAHNVYGYAWSENIGWISFSCENTVAIGSGVDFGVDIDIVTGNFSGYAWSENVGWIDFAPAGPYPAAPNYSTKVSLANGEISGWARALSYGGGWDGWIKMRGTDYGVNIDSNGEFSGWAWSDMVIGWIKFKGDNYGVIGPPIIPPNPPPGPPTFPALPETWDNCSIQGVSKVTLNWIYSDPDGDPQDSYQVLVDNNSNFSSPEVDSCIENTTCNPGNSSQSYTPIANLNFNATYYWKVKVKDDQGNWSDWSATRSFNTPLHAYPWIDFSWAPLLPKAKELIQFANQTIYYGGSSGQSWNWDFGDSQTSLLQNPTHSYLTSGNYQVQLGTRDTAGYYCDGSNRKKSIQISLPLPDWKEISPF